MIQVRIHDNVGISPENIPHDVLNYVQNTYEHVNHYLCFDVENIEAARAIQLVIQGAVGDEVPAGHNETVFYINRNITTQGCARNGLTYLSSTPTPIEREDNQQTEQQHPANTRTNASSPFVGFERNRREEPMCCECDRPESQCICEETCSECGEHIDNCVCEEKEDDMIRDVEANGSYLSVFNEILMHKVEDESQYDMIIADNIQNEAHSRARACSEKNSEYNNCILRMAALQRDIKRLSIQISEDEEVKKIRQQVDTAKTKHYVDNIYFAGKYIVVETENLTTNPLGDQRIVYDVGKMRFFIYIPALLNCANNGSYLKIQNCTREVAGAMCGHVKSDGSTCFGDWGLPISEAIADCDLSRLVELLILFVRSPDITDAWGNDITYFPKREELSNVQA